MKALLDRLLEPLPRGEMPADSDQFRRQLEADAANAKELASIVDHLEQLRKVVANPAMTLLQKEMAQVTLEGRTRHYQELRAVTQ